jgi:meso-butanediol dehydrogenase/(S,S)-butanediol dehydrogenase/diacetyl reductase
LRAFSGVATVNPGSLPGGQIMLLLDSKTAFVTGSGRGIGRGIALELAKAGANVVIADINEGDASHVVAEIEAIDGRAIALKIDVTDENSIKLCTDQALAQFQRIEILVNNAGVMQRGLNENTTTADLDLCYQVNLKGVWSVSRALIPHFKANREGKIINISSVAGRRGSKGAGPYCASKAAVISLTQALAGELGSYGINVNAVCPGTVRTPLWELTQKMLSGSDGEHQIDQLFKVAVASAPLRRPITPEDIGHAVVFLVSERARNITGQALNVCGGVMMN